MKSALIFAAGRGERLQPLTQRIPKALCPIAGIPMIEYHVRKLQQVGIERLFINHAYLGDQIKRHLGNGSRFHLDIVYLPEPPGGLETGGTLLSLLPYLHDEPFITINADIYTDYDFATLPAPAADFLAHLVLVPQSKAHHKADFGLSNTHYVTLDKPEFIFSGIASYSPSAFSKERFGRFSVSPLLRKWAKTYQVSGELYKGIWVDIGTPLRLKYLNTEILQIESTPN